MAIDHGQCVTREMSSRRPNHPIPITGCSEDLLCKTCTWSAGVFVNSFWNFTGTIFFGKTWRHHRQLLTLLDTFLFAIISSIFVRYFCYPFNIDLVQTPIATNHDERPIAEIVVPFRHLADTSGVLSTFRWSWPCRWSCWGSFRWPFRSRPLHNQDVRGFGHHHVVRNGSYAGILLHLLSQSRGSRLDSSIIVV